MSNPQKKKRLVLLDAVLYVLFAFSLATLFFGYGVGVGKYQFFPHDFIDDAMDAGRALKIKYLSKKNVDLWTTSLFFFCGLSVREKLRYSLIRGDGNSAMLSKILPILPPAVPPFATY